MLPDSGVSDGLRRVFSVAAVPDRAFRCWTFGSMGRVGHHGRDTWRREGKRDRCPAGGNVGLGWVQTARDHGGALAGGGVVAGGERGWMVRARTSTMIMDPPQHGHRRHGSGAPSLSAVSWVAG